MLEHGPQLKGVGGPLTPVVVVGDDKDLFTLASQFVDSLYPIFEFFFGVEIVVPLIPARIFFEPVLIISSMQPDIRKIRIGADRTGLDGIPEDRLVNVAEADFVFGEEIEKI